MTSIISTSAGAFIKPMFQNVRRTISTSNVSSGPNYSLQIYKYQLLYDTVISELNTYLKYFTKGQYNQLLSIFTKQTYNKLILKIFETSFDTPAINNLTEFTFDPNKFELMRQSTYKVIDGLQQTVKLVKQSKD